MQSHSHRQTTKNITHQHCEREHWIRVCVQKSFSELIVFFFWWLAPTLGCLFILCVCKNDFSTEYETYTNVHIQRWKYSSNRNARKCDSTHNHHRVQRNRTWKKQSTNITTKLNASTSPKWKKKKKTAKNQLKRNEQI